MPVKVVISPILINEFNQLVENGCDLVDVLDWLSKKLDEDRALIHPNDFMSQKAIRKLVVKYGEGEY